MDSTFSMSLWRWLFIDTLVVFCRVMTFEYNVSFDVDTHKPALNTLPRVLLAFLDFAYFICRLWGLLNIGFDTVHFALYELTSLYDFIRLSSWVHSHSTSICLARLCVVWHPFTSSHHDLDPCMFHFLFISFDLIKMN